MESINFPAPRDKADKPRKRCEKTNKRLLDLDNFGQPINLNFPDGSPQFRGPLGACLNVLVTMVIWVYFAQGMTVLLARGGSKFTASVDEAFHPANYTFTVDNGF